MTVPSQETSLPALAPEEVRRRIDGLFAGEAQRRWNNEDYARFVDALLRWAVTPEEFANLSGVSSLYQWIEHFVPAPQRNQFCFVRQEVPLQLPALPLFSGQGQLLQLQPDDLAYLIVPWQGEKKPEYGLVRLTLQRREVELEPVLFPLNSSLLIYWAGQQHISAHEIARRVFLTMHTATLENPQLYETAMRLLRLRAALRKFFEPKRLFW